MAILSNENAKVLVYSDSAAVALTQSQEMLKSGTNVAGIVVGHGEPYLSPHVRTFGSITEASRVGLADAIVIFSESDHAREAILKALDNRISLIVCTTETLSPLDTVMLQGAARLAGATLLGPHSNGILSPGKFRAGYFCEELCLPGRIGVLTNGGSIVYDVLHEMKLNGIGVSTIVSVGQQQLKGETYASLLPRFEDDDQTDLVVLVTKIDGREEEEAARAIANGISKPVVAFLTDSLQGISSRRGDADADTAPPTALREKRSALKHAGAIVCGSFSNIVPHIVKLTR
jgi:succinyl-CoA synthetase alpha subunit